MPTPKLTTPHPEVKPAELPKTKPASSLMSLDELEAIEARELAKVTARRRAQANKT